MISLRAKFTFALLIMSFVAIGVVGITANLITKVRFEDLVVNRALEGFTSQVKEYYMTYGSWEAARNTEHFLEFVRRNRPDTDRGNPPPQGERPYQPGQSMEERMSPAGQRVEFGGPLQPFLVVNTTGIVLIDLAGRKIGEVITPDELKRAQPILVNDTLIGLAVPMQRPALTEIEERYLSAIEYSWLYSLLIAMVLAIPVGIVFGNIFSAPIQEMRKAIRAMEGGNLRQLVKVRSNDEVGQLSKAFNKMSENLASAHDELTESRTRLSVQAKVLKELSRRDELTQLQNRRAFDELATTLFAQAVRFNHPLTLAMADIDYFKKVNDNFSHAVGDEVLKVVAELINTNLREIDLLARYGGEEFVITFPQTDIKGAAIFANRLRERVADYNWERIASGLSVTLSIGLAERLSEASFKDVLKVADAKLYEAKANGRNQVCY